MSIYEVANYGDEVGYFMLAIRMRKHKSTIL